MNGFSSFPFHLQNDTRITDKKDNAVHAEIINKIMFIYRIYMKHFILYFQFRYTTIL